MASPISEEDEIERVEYMLSDWGRIARKASTALGYPSTSCISVMVDHVKVWTRSKASTWGRITAYGKQQRIMKPIDLDFVGDDFLKIDRIVAKAPGWAQKVLLRAYLYGQPDRIAAKELKVDRETFTIARDQAVRYVIDMLARGGKL